MSDVDIPNLIYLGLFLVVIAGSYLISQRRQIGQTLQYAAIWGLIFVGAILAIGAWDQIRGVVTPQASIARDGMEIRVPQSIDGHFYLMLEVNGTPIRFVVDTGATDMVLRSEDAASAGLNPEELIFSGRARTANGVIETAPVTIESVAIGGIEDRNVRAVVNSAEMPESLLGMGYLSRFASLQISGGELVLIR